MLCCAVQSFTIKAGRLFYLFGVFSSYRAFFGGFGTCFGTVVAGAGFMYWKHNLFDVIAASGNRGGFFIWLNSDFRSNHLTFYAIAV